MGSGLGDSGVCAIGTLGGGTSLGGGLGSCGINNNLSVGEIGTLGGGAAVGVVLGSCGLDNNMLVGGIGALGGDTLGGGC